LPLEEEIKLLENKLSGDFLVNYLNNFFLNLPGGWYSSIYKKNNMYNLTFKEIMNKIGGESNLSEKKLSITPKTFFETIEDLIKKLGIPADKITNLLNERNMNEINSILLPLYIEMRKKGYLRYPDLIQ